MQTVLILLGLAVVLILALIVLALVLPVDVRVRLNKNRQVRLSVHGRFFGGLGPWIRLSADGPRRQKRARKPRRKRKMWSLGHPMSEVIPAVKRLIVNVFAAIRIEELSIEGEFGTGDPAETGHLYGILTPLIYGSGAPVAVTPRFDEACLRGKCTAVLRFTPLVLAAPFVRFGWFVLRPVR